MLRNTLLWASTNPFLAERVPRLGFVKRATKRFMPGEELEDALSEAERLGRAGLDTTVTLLGENLAAAEEADDVARHYLEVLRAIAARSLDTEISVKPTQLGLDFDPGRTRERLGRLAASTESLVWIDMEGSPYVDATLELFRSARAEHENIGLCLQSYLRRTEADLEELLPLRPAIRLVKGAYREPVEIAFAHKAEVDRSFVRLTSRLLRARASGDAGRPVIASHDPRMVNEAGRLVHELGLEKDAYEYAMLFGIQRAQQERLARQGHRLRVLISYGSAWFPWYMRRLAERPANVWFVLRQIGR